MCFVRMDLYALCANVALALMVFSCFSVGLLGIISFSSSSVEVYFPHETSLGLGQLCSDFHNPIES